MVPHNSTGPYLQVVPCIPGSATWSFHSGERCSSSIAPFYSNFPPRLLTFAHFPLHFYSLWVTLTRFVLHLPGGGSDPTAGVLLSNATAAPLCLTVVEPSWIEDAAMAMRLLDATTGYS